MSIGTHDRADRFSQLMARLADVRTWVTEAPPWVVSLTVHGAALLALAFVSATIPAESRPCGGINQA